MKSIIILVTLATSRVVSALPLGSLLGGDLTDLGTDGDVISPILGGDSLDILGSTDLLGGDELTGLLGGLLDTSNLGLVKREPLGLLGGLLGGGSGIGLPGVTDGDVVSPILGGDSLDILGGDELLGGLLDTSNLGLVKREPLGLLGGLLGGGSGIGLPGVTDGDVVSPILGGDSLDILGGNELLGGLLDTSNLGLVKREPLGLLGGLLGGGSGLELPGVTGGDVVSPILDGDSLDILGSTGLLGGDNLDSLLGSVPDTSNLGLVKRELSKRFIVNALIKRGIASLTAKV